MLNFLTGWVIGIWCGAIALWIDVRRNSRK